MGWALVVLLRTPSLLVTGWSKNCGMGGTGGGGVLREGEGGGERYRCLDDVDEVEKVEDDGDGKGIIGVVLWLFRSPQLFASLSLELLGGKGRLGYFVSSTGVFTRGGGDAGRVNMEEGILAERAVGTGHWTVIEFLRFILYRARGASDLLLNLDRSPISDCVNARWFLADRVIRPFTHPTPKHPSLPLHLDNGMGIREKVGHS